MGREYKRLLAILMGTGLLLIVLLQGRSTCSAAEAEQRLAPAAPAAGARPAFAPASAPERTPGPGKPDQPGPSAGPEKKPPEGPGKPESAEKKPEGSDKKPGGEEKKPDAPSVPAIQRPSTPPKPGNPEELKPRPDAQGKIRFNFTNQKWEDVLQWLADISKMSLDWSELPGDYLNLVTTESYTLAEARDQVNRHLLARGYTMLRRGENLSIAKLDKLNTAMVPWVKPDELDQRDLHEFVKVTFPLDWLLAEPTAEELKPMVSQYGKLNPLKHTNRLEVVDAVINLREIRRLLAEEQSKTGEGSLVVPFVLKHTRATEVRELLMQLLGIEDKKPAGPQPGQPGQPQPQPQPQPGQPGPPAAKKEAEVRIVADERLNTVYVSAPPDKLALVRQAVEAIDVPQAHEEPPAHSVTRMKAYRLESLEPEAVLKTLKSLGGLSVDARFEVDKANKTVIAYASLADHVVIASVVDKLDGGSRRSKVIQLTDLRADSVAKTIDYMMGGGPDEKDKKDERSDEEESFNPFFGPERSSARGRGSDKKHEDRFRVDADIKGNRLLLWCNEFELAKVEDLLENLRATRQAGRNAQTVQVHRLVALEPDPFIKTLKDMEALSVGTTLEADRQNRAIIANASEADHVKIRDLITRLDGSGREFQVVQLRRLEADYVAGTVAFMMTGKQEEKKSSSGWGWYPYDYYRRSSRQQKKEDEFRVDADVEFNRLLLWANPVEMQEVQKLLVKLGEVPAEGGNRNTIRILDIPPGPERDRLLEQLQRTWPSLLPNPLKVPAHQPSEDEKKGPEPSKEPAKPSGATTEKDVSPSSPLAERKGSQFRLAQLGPTTAETPSKPSASGASDGPAPVTVSEGPDGRLIIASEDTQALDRLEVILSESAASRKQYDVIRLRYAEAYWVALTLKDYFGEKDKKGDGTDDYWAGWFGWPRQGSSGDETRRLSKRKPLKFISDDTTNTILVQGATPEQMRTIKGLVDIYDKPPMTDSESARKTETIRIRYAKAAVVAEAIKDVYRDLLSENDKALINSKKQQQEQRSDRSYTYIYGAGDKDKEKEGERKPKFKGYLSLGIYEESNSLVISAPEFLFRDIARLIQQLDDAARPVTDQVLVLQLRRGVDQAQLQEKLSKIFQGSAVSTTGAKENSHAPAGAAENHGSKPTQPTAKD